MRPRVRAAGLAACALLSGMTLVAAGSLQGGGAGAAWHAAADPSATPNQPGAPARGAGTTTQVRAMNKADPPAGALPADQAIRELAAGNSRPPVMVVDSAGRLLSVTAQPATTLKVPTGARGPDAFVRRYAAAFGLTAGYGVQRGTTTRLPGGDTVVRYRQQAAGVPLIGGELVVTIDRTGGVRSTLGETSPRSPTATTAKVDAQKASATALAEAAQRYGRDATTLTVSQRALWLYDPQLIGAPGRAEVRPTWWVKVSEAAGAEVASVLVDALDGSVSLAISEHQEARNRIVCDLANARVDLNYRSRYACSLDSALGAQSTTQREGGPTSTVAQVRNAFAYLGATYDFYNTRFGRDSYDGQGGQIAATVRVCHLSGSCPYPNAFWDGTQLVFGQDFVTDDVVAHEFTHGVTDYSSQLVYAYESGAINEAISDIMGEFVDQSYTAPGEDTSKLWLIGEDLPGIGAIRDMADPERFQQPATVGGTYWSTSTSDNGGVHTNSGPANRLAYLISQDIGTAKSAQLWYRTAVQLPSSADYNTLGRAIYSTCLQLVGFQGFVGDDCRHVQWGVSAIGISIGLQIRRPIQPRPGPTAPRKPIG